MLSTTIITGLIFINGILAALALPEANLPDSAWIEEVPIEYHMTCHQINQPSMMVGEDEVCVFMQTEATKLSK